MDPALICAALPATSVYQYQANVPPVVQLKMKSMPMLCGELMGLTPVEAPPAPTPIPLGSLAAAFRAFHGPLPRGRASDFFEQ